MQLYKLSKTVTTDFEKSKISDPFTHVSTKFVQYKSTVQRFHYVRVFALCSNLLNRMHASNRKFSFEMHFNTTNNDVNTKEPTLAITDNYCVRICANVRPLRTNENAPQFFDIKKSLSQ